MTKHSKDSKKEHKSDHDVKKKEKKDRKEKREKGKISSKHSSSHPYVTEQDYFRYMEEFQVWLKTQGIDKHFENLTSDSARDIFAQEFCRAWNKGKLPDMYYQGISSELRRSLGRTSHSWKISLSDADRDRLNDVSDSVRDVTGGLGEDLPPWKTLGNSSYSTNALEKDSNVLKMNYMTEMGSGDDTKRHKLQEVRDATRRAKELAEEISPRALAGSREALLDKRRAVGAATHASFLAKSIDGLPELTDEDIYGVELHEEARREAIYNPASQRQQRRLVERQAWYRSQQGSKNLHCAATDISSKSF
jgi:hypothetical protein